MDKKLRAIQLEVIKAIQSERKAQTRVGAYVISRREKAADIWRLRVDLKQTHSKLPAQIEDSVCWWPEPRGAGRVLSVIPEKQQINLRYCSSTPPEVGEKIWIYSWDFLEPLQKAWEMDERAEECMEWLIQTREGGGNEPDLRLTPELFRELRKNQRFAFQLPNWRRSYLWGPPGTGKTHTIGTLVSQILLQYSRSRVLLLSTTNVAVDQALTSVDKALEKLAKRFPGAPEIRKKCARIGNNFSPNYYVGRRHLLGQRDELLLQDIVRLMAECPGKADVLKYDAWKRKITALRQRLNAESLENAEEARLLSMTTYKAMVLLNSLDELPPFDLVVFDEASQVNFACAAALVKLGKRVLFAGDPKQLSPIVQSRSRLAAKWLGMSLLDLMADDSKNTVFLDEQSRMAAPISRVVSSLFYSGRLKVAEDCLENSAWEQNHSPGPLATNVLLLQVSKEGQRCSSMGGWIRAESAVSVAKVASKLVRSGLRQEDILVLSPFRAQKARIRIELKGAGLKKVQVSTVHSAQGTERQVILFDPTRGDSWFLQQGDSARLINVALSRAKALLLVFLSAGDRKNPLLNQLAKQIEIAGEVHGPGWVDSIERSGEVQRSESHPFLER